MRAVDWYHRGQKLLQQRCISEALECFHTAQQLGFNANRCAASRWECWMLSGKFECAWAESDQIAASGAPDQHRFWDGRPWNGKRVMVRCLHGLGDTIQFIRYAPMLRETCSALTVQTHPQLATLLAGVAGVDRASTWGPAHTEKASDWDIQMEVTELPRAFRTTVDSLPARVPYIRVPQERLDWAAKQFPERRRLRIGISWQSGPWDPDRSIPLDHFAAIFSRRDHQVFSLQKGADLGSFQSPGPVQELERYASDVRDTAAFILNLDLVISVDTMTAHLAGALGRPVWILLPFSANWRWMLGRRNTPWYPTAQLFRQAQPGDWSTVIAEAAATLDSLKRVGLSSPVRPSF
ncbi:MAG: repeat protein [Bryobacterales bacterium]|nr:repeat protein [Bryobacterales bacterium]